MVRRRSVLKDVAGITAAIGTVSLAGCSGGDGSDGNDGGDGSDGDGTTPGSSDGSDGGVGVDSVPMGSFYDLSGPSASVGVPYSEGARDGWQYLNEQDVLPFDIDQEWVDTGMSADVATNTYQDYLQKEVPLIEGWATLSSELLGPKLPAEEILMISASASAKLHTEETSYNIFPNLSYSDMGRISQTFINDQNPDAKVALIRNATSFGKSPSEAMHKYADEIGQDLVDDIVLKYGATDASTQVTRARENDVDWIVHNNTPSEHQALLSARQDIYPEVNVIGLGWTQSEYTISENPALSDGTYVVKGFRTVEEVLDNGGKAADALNYIFGNIRDVDVTNREVLNMDYIRGFMNPIVISEAWKNTVDMGGDPTSGHDLREGLFEIDDFDVWGISDGFQFSEDDRRPTMTGRIYMGSDGDMPLEDTITLDRTDEYYAV